MHSFTKIAVIFFITYIGFDYITVGISEGISSFYMGFWI